MGPKLPRKLRRRHLLPHPPRLQPRLRPRLRPRPRLKLQNHALATCASPRGRVLEEVAKATFSKNSSAEPTLSTTSPSAGSKNASFPLNLARRDLSRTSMTTRMSLSSADLISSTTRNESNLFPHRF